MRMIGQITQSEFESIIVPMCKRRCRLQWARLPVTAERKARDWDEFLNFVLESVFLAIVKTNADLDFAKRIAGTRCKYAVPEFFRSLIGRYGCKGTAIGSKKSVFAHAFTDYFNEDLCDRAIDCTEDPRKDHSDTIDVADILGGGFTERDITIIQMLVDGYNQADISKFFKLTISRVSQLVDQIRERMLKLNTLNCQTHVKQIKGKRIGGKRIFKPRSTTTTEH